MSPPKARFIKARTPATQITDPTPQAAPTWGQDPLLSPNPNYTPPAQPLGEGETRLGEPLPTYVPPQDPSLTWPANAMNGGAAGITPTQFANLPQVQQARSNTMGLGPPLEFIKRPSRFVPVTGNPQLGTPPPTPTAKPVDQWATEDAYAAEYWEYVAKDPVRRRWWAQRAITMGLVEFDPEAKDLVAEKEFAGGAIYRLWQATGETVRLNPVLNQMTPEEYVDGYYNRLGGDEAFEAAKAATLKKIPSPIQTTTQTSTNTFTMSRPEAEAAADQIAINLLGHMATSAQLRQARSVMNGILKANPTVSTTTTVSDQTDPNNPNITSSTSTKQGASPVDAANAYEMKIRRSSEGMAYGVGKLMEDAMMRLDRGL